MTDHRAAHVKALRHIIPILFTMYVLSYLDRVNIAFAAPAGLNRDLALTTTQ
jgi:hypothetical protein